MIIFLARTMMILNYRMRNKWWKCQISNKNPLIRKNVFTLAWGGFWFVPKRVKANNGRWKCTKTSDEPPVKIGKPQKSLDRFTIVWGGPISNCFYFGRVHPNAFRRQNKPQELNWSCVKLALLQLGEYAIL